MADAHLNGEKARFIAVVPNSENKFYRARNGEFGLQEAWTVAKYVRQAIEEDKDSAEKRLIVPIVDVPGQAFGYHEELFGIYLACAASVEAFSCSCSTKWAPNCYMCCRKSNFRGISGTRYARKPYYFA